MVNLLSKLIFGEISEGRRYGKTVIIGTNVASSGARRSFEEESSDGYEDDSHSDASMGENPSKRAKMTDDSNE